MAHTVWNNWCINNRDECQEHYVMLESASSSCDCSHWSKPLKTSDECGVEIEKKTPRRNRENYRSQLCSIVLLLENAKEENQIGWFKRMRRTKMQCRDELFPSSSIVWCNGDFPFHYRWVLWTFHNLFYPLILRRLSDFPSHHLRAERFSYVSEFAHSRRMILKIVTIARMVKKRKLVKWEVHGRRF